MELQLETVTSCQARCHFCTLPKLKDRWGQVMTSGLFLKIVNEALEIKQIDKYVLHGLGEPLLDPHLMDRIWYIRSQTSDGIEIFTNGMAMSPESFDSLKKAGLSSLVFSLNAVNAKQHEEVMGVPGQFDKVCANIEYAIENKGDMHIEIHAVANGDQFVVDDVVKLNERWGYKREGGYAKSVIEGNWAGDNRTVPARANRTGFSPSDCCSRALDQIYVTADGKVTTCCFDPTGKQVFGDLNRQTIREVYNSEKYLRFREAHADDRADLYDICANCTRI